jgi:plasmid maintenance system antidote protein VapI
MFRSNRNEVSGKKLRPAAFLLPFNLTKWREMELIGRTMIHYLLKGQRNLSLNKAKVLAAKTGTDPLLWMDRDRAAERREVWAKVFGAKK